MENNKNIEPINDPEVNMGAHDPKVDLARNKNLFKKSLYFAGAFFVVLLAVCAFNQCGEESSQKDMSNADYALITASDSASYAAAMQMYNDIASSSDATSAQRAKIISAGQAYENGEYEKALGYIKDVKTKSPIVETLKYCLQGDCEINLDKVDDAISSFKSAVEEANNNPELAPYAMTKLANAYRFKGDYKSELEVLKALFYRYPAYNPQIESEIARAEALAK